MSKQRSTIIGIMFIGSVLLGSACKDEGNQVTNCSEALNNLYDIGCAIFVDGDQVSRYDAIEGCQDERDQAEAFGCMTIRQSALDCLAGADTCGECDSQMTQYNNCMG
jgi:hypothetical protein